MRKRFVSQETTTRRLTKAPAVTRKAAAYLALLLLVPRKIEKPMIESGAVINMASARRLVRDAKKGTARLTAAPNTSVKETVFSFTL
jgi:hypothetical protein